jgi:RDD family protein
MLSLLFPAVLFGLVYFPTLKYLSVGLVTPYAKVDVWKRLLAAWVDGMPAIAAWFLYRNTGSWWGAAVAVLYLLLRDGIGGQSLGKLLVGLVVVNVQTGRLCTWRESALRNVFALIPGANVVAIFLESVTLIRDPQGQRLGDRLAQTQVIEGFGVKDLATSFQEWWTSVFGHLERHARRPRRQPAER